MKPLRIAVNGLGRIGRAFLRIAWDNPLFDIVALASRSPLPYYAHLMKFDSTYGTWDQDIKVKGDSLHIDGKKIRFFEQAEANNLPWKKVAASLVVEASGKYRRMDDAGQHLDSGAKYVLITAPIDGPGQTLVYGVNHEKFDPETHRIISGASCTSICSSMVVKVIEEEFGIHHGFLSTVHAFTSDQNLQDSAHKDFRRARAASQSIIPTSTGVTETIDKLFPSLAGKFDGLSLRVPIVVPSVLNLTAELKKKTTAKKVNQAFERASRGKLKGELDVSDLPLVSVDYIQNQHGAIIDLLSTKVVDGKMLSVLAWYDNEWGYVAQVVRLLEYLAKKIVG